MAYVAVKGGQEAIEASLNLVAMRRALHNEDASIDAILQSLRPLVNQVQSEASLWAPRLAAIALKQAEGSIEEAVFLMRAFRSTLERNYTTKALSTNNLRVKRRISAAFKDIPGGQVLGASNDYAHRLIDFALDGQDEAQRKAQVLELENYFIEKGKRQNLRSLPATLPKVSDYLRAQGILEDMPEDNSEPGDITQNPLSFPCPRSVRLQILTRALTQGLISFGYAAIRGFGDSHPTVGELRCGDLPIELEASPNDDESPYYIGSIEVCEVESYIPHTRKEGTKEIHALEIGYGLVYGSDESKAIAMSVMDHSLSQDNTNFPTQDQEFVLYHLDGVEATGFISHLKLPHYVTFQSKLDSTRRSMKNAAEKEGERDARSL